ncbi:MAG: hypothetical protein CVU46_01955 [Chloroflexi bacterium HGW-Chloroflexi-8]|jgi:hypothetical protein|nr:MAG: hypothetical protein CVU46_01955 [Chloroflexi bacterium HGW-Chloroflexi-8]
MHRFGIFLFWLGGILLLLFFVSSQSQTPNYQFLLFSLAGLFLGTILVLKTRKEHIQKNSRFRIIKGFTKKNNHSEETKNELDQKSSSQTPISTRRKHY